jgi:hypothetical protein
MFTHVVEAVLLQFDIFIKQNRKLFAPCLFIAPYTLLPTRYLRGFR